MPQEKYPSPIAEQTKQKILTSIKDSNPAFLFQPTKNTLFRCLLRPYNQFKKDQEDEKSELKTEILEINGKAARRKFRFDQIQRQKDSKTISEMTASTKEVSQTSVEESVASSDVPRKKQPLATVHFKLSDYLVSKSVSVS